MQYRGTGPTYSSIVTRLYQVIRHRSMHTDTLNVTTQRSYYAFLLKRKVAYRYRHVTISTIVAAAVQSYKPNFFISRARIFLSLPCPTSQCWLRSLLFPRLVTVTISQVISLESNRPRHTHIHKTSRMLYLDHKSGRYRYYLTAGANNADWIHKPDLSRSCQLPEGFISLWWVHAVSKYTNKSAPNKSAHGHVARKSRCWAC